MFNRANGDYARTRSCDVRHYPAEYLTIFKEYTCLHITYSLKFHVLICKKELSCIFVEVQSNILLNSRCHYQFFHNKGTKDIFCWVKLFNGQGL